MFSARALPPLVVVVAECAPLAAAELGAAVELEVALDARPARSALGEGACDGTRAGDSDGEGDCEREGSDGGGAAARAAKCTLREGAGEGEAKVSGTFCCKMRSSTASSSASCAVIAHALTVRYALLFRGGDTRSH
jgi:hypothetical protein